MGGVVIVSKFIYALTLILVIAKIFGLVAFTWGVCLLPAVCLIVVKTAIYFTLLNKVLDAGKQLLEEVDEGKEVKLKVEKY